MTTQSPEELLKIDGARRLHVGGKQIKTGWQILNALPGDGVDHLGDVRDLSGFADASFDAVYASHVLEHLSYHEVLGAVLSGLGRILRPGGKLFVSVPDLDVLCRLFVSDTLQPQERFQVMRMMFGGQTDAYDFHYVGLNGEFLTSFIGRAGFSQVYRVRDFGIFEDTSALRFRGVPISVNLIAVK